MMVNELFERLRGANEDAEVAFPDGKPIRSIVYKKGIFFVSDEYQPIDRDLLSGIEDHDEAVCTVAHMLGATTEHIIYNDIVLEYYAEDDNEEFTTWYYPDGTKVDAGDPIGFAINIDGEETEIFPYNGLKEVDEQ
jgi:hypothetical protein